MFAVCNACQQSHQEFEYRPSATGFHATCNRCQQVMSVSWSTQGQRAPSSKNDINNCPKCRFLNVGDAAHCAGCGLDKKRWLTWKKPVHVADPSLEMEWDKLVDDWKNETKHQNIADLCRSRSDLPWLAFKYQERKSKYPEDIVCQNHLVKITKQVQLFMLKDNGGVTSGSPGKQMHKRRKGMMVLVFFVVVLALGVFLTKKIYVKDKSRLKHAPRGTAF